MKNVIETAIPFQYDKTVENKGWSEKECVIDCGHCHFTSIIPSSTTNGLCPVCGSSRVQNSQIRPGIKPVALIPFRNNVNIKEYFYEWASSKLFSPSGLKDLVSKIRYNRMFIPAYLFEIKTNTKWTAEAGIDKKRLVNKSRLVSKTRTGFNGQIEHYSEWEHYTEWETYTEWHKESGQLNADIPNIDFINTHLIAAVNDDFLSYDFKSVVPLSMDSLKQSGIEKYSISPPAVWPNIKIKMESLLRKEITNGIKADRVRNIEMLNQITACRWQLILLPVYIVNYEYEHRNYTAYINGQNMKIYGRTPVSILKLIIINILIAFALSVILHIIGFRLGLLSTFYDYVKSLIFR